MLKMFCFILKPTRFVRLSLTTSEKYIFDMIPFASQNSRVYPLNIFYSIKDVIIVGHLKKNELAL